MTVTQEEFENELEINPNLVVLLTDPSWCAPCRQFEPHWDRATGAVEEFRFLKINVGENDWAVPYFEVASIPTVKVYKHGEHSRDIKVPLGGPAFVRELRN